MTGFKNFILKGNLVELAVAFVMAVSFAAVVTSMKSRRANQSRIDAAMALRWRRRGRRSAWT